MPLDAVPLDLISEVYTFLPPRQQNALRATSSRTIAAFDGAVHHELIDKAASCRLNQRDPRMRATRGDDAADVETLHEEAANISWSYFPAPRYGVAASIGVHMHVANLSVGMPHLKSTLSGAWWFNDAWDASPAYDRFAATALTVTDFGDLEEMPSKLFSDRRALVSLRLGGLDGTGSPQLKAFAWRSLGQTAQLRRLVVSHLTALHTIEGEFLYHCPSLESATFENLPALATVGENWLRDCPELKTVVFKAVGRLETIGDNFLRGCDRLEEVDFRGLTGLRQVGRRWLGEGGSLRRVTYDGLASLESVDDGWMYACRDLVDVRLSGLKSLKSIGNSCLSQCAFLRTVQLDDLPELTSCGEFFMRGGHAERPRTVVARGVRAEKTVAMLRSLVPLWNTTVVLEH
jgi:hypothetical protein